MELWISPSNEAAVNLALEELLLQEQFSDRRMMLLYINRPCVVVGRNQCHYKEVNFRNWFSETCPVHRRVSGGGTVYHDEGNLNFAFIVPHRDEWINQYQPFNSPIRDTLGDIGIELEFDERNNFRFRGKKVSGNAQFTNRKRMISHGTFLVNARLESLRNALQPNPFEVLSKSVASVRSPVINLQESGIIERAEELLEVLSKMPMLQGVSIRDLPDEIEPLVVKHRSASWNLDRSPDCSIQWEDGSGIGVSRGNITRRIVLGTSEWESISPLPMTDTQKKWPVINAGQLF